MSNQPKIIALGLEQVVLSCRERGLSLDQTVAECNAELARQAAAVEASESVTVTLSKSTIKRYLASLDAATVPVVHQPQIAEENAALAIDFGRRLVSLDAKLGRWLNEADTATKTVQVGYGETSTFETGPDWQARTQVAREMREHLKQYADLMQRIHDAEQVKAFQESVVEAIREASPEVAAAVVQKLRARQSIRKAALLGA